MSRIGKNIIQIPEKTTIAVADGALTVKGPLGELSKTVHPQVTISVDGASAHVTPNNNSKLARSLWGTFASLMQSMVDGVNTKFEKKLEIRGVGYKVELQGKTLKFSVGFSHPVEIEIPDDIEVSVEKTMISVSGIDKEHVGQFAANIRAIKKPEPYKGKGIRYVGEYVRQKQGKKTV